MGKKSSISKYGLFGTIKHIRVRKREKSDKSNMKKYKSRHRTRYDIKTSDGRYTSKDYSKNIYEGIRIQDDEEDKSDESTKSSGEEKIEPTTSSNPNLISFDHELTDFEYKLRYLNLKDVTGKEYGRFFPAIRSKLVIVDDDGRKFSVIRAGNNQISGDVLAFFNANGLKPGDVFLVEFDRDEKSDDGRPVLHLKTKKE